jgi:CheY-like chemotaxis protein
MAPPLLLLVDDAPEIGYLVRRLTRQAGQELVVCCDVPEALVALETARPDLIVLDLNLPGPNGLELCRQLRRTPSWETIPIALFGLPERSEDIAAGLDAGIDFVLSKDLLARPEAWRQRINEILVAAAGPADGEVVRYQSGFMPTHRSYHGITALNDALWHAVVPRLGLPVVRVLLRRVATRVSQSAPLQEQRLQGLEIAPWADWLSADGLGLVPSSFPLAQRPYLVALFAAHVVEEIERVWGSAAGTKARPAFAELLAGLDAASAHDLRQP